MGPKKEGFSHSHIAYESQLIVLLLHFGKKKLAKESSSCMMFVWYSWYLFDTPQKIFDKLLSTSIFSAFFQASNPSLKKRSPEIEPRLLRSRPLMHPETPGIAAKWVGSVGWWEDHVGHVGIDLFSFKLPPKTSHPMVTYPSSQAPHQRCWSSCFAPSSVSGSASVSAMAPAMLCSQRKTRNEKGRNIVFFWQIQVYCFPQTQKEAKVEGVYQVMNPLWM